MSLYSAIQPPYLFTIYIGLAILLWTCGQKSELINNQWHVIDGTYNNKPIKFQSTDFIFFTDNNGKEILNLNFSKDETILLPGINSPKISAKWTIIDNKIHITVDSSKYHIYNGVTEDLSFLEASDSTPEGNVVKENRLQPEFNNPMMTKEFKEAMEIYEQPFVYFISLDTLRLESQNIRIRAVRDRTIDELFKKL